MKYFLDDRFATSKFESKKPLRNAKKKRKKNTRQKIDSTVEWWILFILVENVLRDSEND